MKMSVTKYVHEKIPRQYITLHKFIRLQCPEGADFHIFIMELDWDRFWPKAK